jgi:hypothetical protein
MAKCLVTTLPESVSDTSLLKLGDFLIHYKHTTGNVGFIEWCAASQGLTLTIIGDGYFTDATGTANQGKTFTVPPNYIGRRSYLSNGEYDICVHDKYNLSYRIIMTGRSFTFDFDNLEFARPDFDNLTL